jgi:hypothetical protein
VTGMCRFTLGFWNRESLADTVPTSRREAIAWPAGYERSLLPRHDLWPKLP